jgi:hypothetical protein
VDREKFNPALISKTRINSHNKPPQLCVCVCLCVSVCVYSCVVLHRAPALHPSSFPPPPPVSSKHGVNDSEERGAPPTYEDGVGWGRERGSDHDDERRRSRGDLSLRSVRGSERDRQGMGGGGEEMYLRMSSIIGRGGRSDNHVGEEEEEEEEDVLGIFRLTSPTGRS